MFYDRRLLPYTINTKKKRRFYIPFKKVITYYKF